MAVFRPHRILIPAIRVREISFLFDEGFPLRDAPDFFHGGF